MPRAYRHWTAKQRELIRLHYGPLSPQPWPIARLAAACGRSKYHVRGAARRYGSSYRTNNRRAKAKMRPLYDLGWTDRAIALRLDCHPATVAKWRRREGLRANGRRGRRRKFTDEALLRLRGAGVSIRKAAKALGAHRTTINRHLARLRKEGRPT